MAIVLSGTTNDILVNGVSVATDTEVSSAVAPLATISYVDSITRGGFVRQTVQSALVDSNGYANFISIGTGLSVNISATITNIKLSASGGLIDRNIIITANTTISGLTASTTNYLYADISSTGTVTLGATTLVPNYQFGGTASIVNGQHTFNIGEMKMYVGNGTTATQVYRVFLGEAVTGASTVTSVINYAINGSYDSGWISTLPQGVTTTKNHNIGLNSEYVFDFIAKCITSELSYAVGDIIKPMHNWTATSGYNIFMPVINRNTISHTSYSAAPYIAVTKNTATVGVLTVANWAYKITVNRGW